MFRKEKTSGFRACCGQPESIFFYSLLTLWLFSVKIHCICWQTLKCRLVYKHGSATVAVTANYWNEIFNEALANPEKYLEGLSSLSKWDTRYYK